ncbi:hypothetical protein EJ02DRAFT_456322 [Clathrospora elynae]|uniref:F-box domain-containing protein n=1 Tax=Clathrospora elynae TaxID=706981 RepID=A0A6A5SNJ6_9PLEO|nr:hypothetical protein EJ02DRAFT_456322 [Clathrospora elynae]
MRLTILFLFTALLPSPILARHWTTKDECPTEIKTTISADPCQYYDCGDIPRFHTMDTVHAALLTCPNITTLDLRVTNTGCSSSPDRWNFPFKPAGGESYPNLKVLRLEGYDFKGNEQEWKYSVEHWSHAYWRWIKYGHWKKWLDWIRLPLEQRAKSNVELWIDAMDWSGIEELMIDATGSPTPEAVKKEFGKLTSLRRLETTDLPFIQALPNNSIEHLTWIGKTGYEDVQVILEHQGESLQSLEYRCPETWRCSFDTGFNLSILQNGTQNLTHISINIPRNGTWPLETLEKVAAIPTLRSADLWMNIQSLCREQMEEYQMNRPLIPAGVIIGEDLCKGEDQFQKPFLGEKSALELFTHMREQKEGEELSEVTFWVGDWTRPWDGALYSPAWVEGKRAKVICKADRDVEIKGWCLAKACQTDPDWDGELDDWSVLDISKEY